MSAQAATIERAIAHHEVTRGLKSKLDMVRAHIAALTPRKRQVFALVIRGDTNKQTARALGCTERTIKAHRHRVMEQTQIQSLTELVSLAERIGVLDDRSGSPESLMEPLKRTDRHPNSGDAL